MAMTRWPENSDSAVYLLGEGQMRGWRTVERTASQSPVLHVNMGSLQILVPTHILLYWWHGVDGFNFDKVVSGIRPRPFQP